MSTLYLVATPIGNLEDLSARALRILNEVALIAAEDTRQTRKLLSRYAIDTAMVAYHEHNKNHRGDDLLLSLVNGNDVALVSDAGTPGISDPGYELVQTVIAAGFEVIAIPGPCAAITGLVSSGLRTDRFCFGGFPPRRMGERRTWFEEFRPLAMTLIYYEAPHRLLKTLNDALAVFGNREAAVARELTKLHEQVVRGTLQELLEHFTTTAPRGEIVLLIAGAAPPGRQERSSISNSAADDPPQSEPEAATVPQAQVTERLKQLRAEGFSGTKAAKQVARELSISRQDAYRLWTELD